MERLGIICVLLVCGCGLSACLGLGARSTTPLSTPVVQGGEPQRVGLLTVLGEEAQQAAFAAQNEALNAADGGIGVAWKGGAAQGKVTPGPIHRVNSRDCRDVVHEAERNRERLRGRATLCKGEDGAWQLLE